MYIYIYMYIFLIAVCSGGCIFGSCSSPESCTCNSGFTGSTCASGMYRLHFDSLFYYKRSMS